MWHSSPNLFRALAKWQRLFGFRKREENKNIADHVTTVAPLTRTAVARTECLLCSRMYQKSLCNLRLLSLVHNRAKIYNTSRLYC